MHIYIELYTYAKKKTPHSLITNRYYIGIHSTIKLDDGYIGSGVRLLRSIRKHGKENHIKEILEFFTSREETEKKRKYLD